MRCSNDPLQALARPCRPTWPRVRSASPPGRPRNPSSARHGDRPSSGGRRLLGWHPHNRLFPTLRYMICAVLLYSNRTSPLPGGRLVMFQLSRNQGGNSYGVKPRNPTHTSKDCNLQKVKANRLQVISDLETLGSWVPQSPATARRPTPVPPPKPSAAGR